MSSKYQIKRKYRHGYASEGQWEKDKIAERVAQEEILGLPPKIKTPGKKRKHCPKRSNGRHIWKFVREEVVKWLSTLSVKYSIYTCEACGKEKRKWIGIVKN